MKKKVPLDSRILLGTLNYLEDLLKHLETRSNWLIGVASVILIFLLSNFNNFILPLQKIGAIIILLGCMFAIYQLLFNLVPALYKSKDYKEVRAKDNIFSFGKTMDRQVLIDHLKKMGELDNKEIFRTLSDKIYELRAHRLPRRVRNLKSGGWALTLSVIIGSILILIGYLI